MAGRRRKAAGGRKSTAGLAVRKESAETLSKVRTSLADPYQEAVAYDTVTKTLPGSGSIGLLNLNQENLSNLATRLREIFPAHSVQQREQASALATPALSAVLLAEMLEPITILINTSIILTLLQVIYRYAAGSFPFNCFLSGVFTTGGVAVLGIALRMQLTTPWIFKHITHQKAVSDFLCCCLLLFVCALTFMG